MKNLLLTLFFYLSFHCAYTQTTPFNVWSLNYSTYPLIDFRVSPPLLIEGSPPVLGSTPLNFYNSKLEPIFTYNIDTKGILKNKYGTTVLEFQTEFWSNLQYIQHREKRSSYLLYRYIGYNNTYNAYLLKLDTIANTVSSRTIKLENPSDRLFYFPSTGHSDWWVVSPPIDNEDTTLNVNLYKYTGDSLILKKAYPNKGAYQIYSRGSYLSCKVDETRQELYFMQDSIVKMHYDKETGELKKTGSMYLGGQNVDYDYEISENGRWLYVLYQGNNFEYSIDQFDLELFNQTEKFKSSKKKVTNIYEITNHPHLDRAPNGTIYFFVDDRNYMGIIENSNESVPSCTFKPKEIVVNKNIGKLPFLNYKIHDVITCPLNINTSSDCKHGIQFNISGDTPSTQEWDFGDGDSSKDPHPFHVYRTVGVYTVKLKAIYADGSTKTASKQVKIDALLPKLKIQIGGK